MNDLIPISFGSKAALLGLLTLPPPRVATGRGVVVCPPLGHQNVCAYRPLRTLAERLADRGLAVIRIEWPGCGDSDDVEFGPTSDARVWTTAVSEAAQILRDSTGVEEVAVVGLRIGATFALLAASEDPTLTQLVALAPFATGRAYLRELRAFHALAQASFSEPDAAVTPVPTGSLESSGFLFAPDEVRALEQIDLTKADLAAFAGRGVLVVSAQPDRSVTTLTERLAEAGAQVTMETSAELARLWDGTSVSVLPRSCGTLITDRLAAAAPPASPRDRRLDARPGELVLSSGQMVERAQVVETKRGRLFGVSCEPENPGPNDDLWLIFLNAGKVRRIGPNRLSTMLARRWARAGTRSFRFDLYGIGDSDGERDDDEVATDYDARWYFDEGFATDISEILNHLAEGRQARRFVLIGVCASASLALEATLADERVVGAVLVNPRVLFWSRRSAWRHAWRDLRAIATNPGSWRGLRQWSRSRLRDALAGMAVSVTARRDAGGSRARSSIDSLACVLERCRP